MAGELWHFLGGHLPYDVEIHGLVSVDKVVPHTYESVQVRNAVSKIVICSTKDRERLSTNYKQVLHGEVKNSICLERISGLISQECRNLSTG